MSKSTWKAFRGGDSLAAVRPRARHYVRARTNRRVSMQAARTMRDEDIETKAARLPAPRPRKNDKRVIAHGHGHK